MVDIEKTSKRASQTMALQRAKRREKEKREREFIIIRASYLARDCLVV